VLGRWPRHDGLTEVLGTYRHSEPKRRSDLYLPDPPNAAMFSTQTLRHAISIVGFVTGCVLVASSPAFGKQRGLCADSKNRLCGREVTVTSSVKPTVPAACYASRRKMWLEMKAGLCAEL
jgi:hypothetical protein